jgi:ribulose-phosphate 3-epimerase
MSSKKSISVSILNVYDLRDFLTCLNESKLKLSSFSKVAEVFDIKVHLDIMDNKFVPNFGVDLESIKIVKELGFFADVHLMVENPLNEYIDKAISYGADNITIHYEIDNFDENIVLLNNKVKKVNLDLKKNITIGVAIKPDTDIRALKRYEDMFSKVLLMTVEPGFGGQEYILNVNDKIDFIKSNLDNKVIQIDGGVNFETIAIPLRLGVDDFVIGSYITKKYKNELYDRILKLCVLNVIESIEKTSNIEFDSRILQIVPGGYGQGDELIGVTVPNIRKCANTLYKYIEVKNLDSFISSKYHDYKKFAVFCLSNSMKKNKNVVKINKLFENNLKYVNNWDLTDESGPNILANYLFTLDKVSIKNKLMEYIDSEELWVRRIGIVSLLTFIRKKYDIDFILDICSIVAYDKRDLIQKATGWVLREAYKNEPKEIVNYLINKNKVQRLPNILLNYACEKMSKEEKDRVKKI